MKKIGIIILIAILLITTVFLAVACDVKDSNGLIKLRTPKGLVVSGDALSWEPVNHAKKYYISIDGEESESESTSFIIQKENRGTYKVKVRAYGDGIKYGTSDFSNEIDFVQKQRLAKPILKVDGNVLTWDEVEGAANYYILILDNENKQVGSTVTTATRSYTFEGDNFVKPSIFKAMVTALPADTSVDLDKSLASEIEYVITSKLTTPKFNDLTATRIRWNGVSNAINYRIKVTNKQTQVSFETQEVAVTNFDIAKLGITDAGDYDLQIKAVGDGKVFFDSDYSEPLPEYQLTRLKQMDKSSVMYEVAGATEVTNGNGQIRLGDLILKWQVKESDYPEFTGTKIILRTKNASGNEVLSAINFTISKQPITGDKGEVTIEHDSDGKIVYNYQYVLDREFINLYNNGSSVDLEYSKDEDYYGKYYDIYFQVTNSENRFITPDSVKIDCTYLSYKVPFFSTMTQAYQLNNVGEFAYFVKHASDKDASGVLVTSKYTILSNIDFKNYTIQPIEEFGGVLEGNAILKNFVVDGGLTKHEYFGFIKKNYGEINGISFIDVKIKASNSQYVGFIGLNGLVKDPATVQGAIRDCLVDGEIVGDNAIVGGLAAKNISVIEECQSNATVTGLIVGGLVGVNEGDFAKISKSSANGVVSAKQVVIDDYEGNDLADIPKVITASPFDLEIIAGGLVAYNDGIKSDISISWSWATGNVNAQLSNAAPNYIVTAGGLVGYNLTEIKNSYSGKIFSLDIATDSNVQAGGTGAKAGGFVGVNGAKISTSYSNHSVLATGQAAGFVAENLPAGNIANCFSMRRSERGNEILKGFASVNSGTISDSCYYSRYGIVDNNITGVTKITGDNYLDGIIDVVGDSSFGKIKKNQNDNEPNGVFLKNMIYLDQTKTETLTNTQPKLTGFGVASDGTKHEYEYVNENISFGTAGEQVLNYSSKIGEVAVFNKVKVIVVIK